MKHPVPGTMFVWKKHHETWYIVTAVIVAIDNEISLMCTYADGSIGTRQLRLLGTFELKDNWTRLDR